MYRVGSSRVTLDLVVRAFNRGATLEEIAQDFPSLQLSDIYQVIGYYLKHSSELAEYFDRRRREEQGMLEAHRYEQQTIPAGSVFGGRNRRHLTGLSR